MTDVQVFCESLVVICLMRVSIAGAYHKRLSMIPCLLSSLSHGLTPTNRLKLHENVWYCICHTVSFTINAWILLQTTWLKSLALHRDFTVLHRGVPSHPLSQYGRSFYMVSLAFWTSCILFLAVETRRKDFQKLVMHHILTFILVIGSFVYNFHRLGMLVLLLHDVVDILLYFAKSLNYKQYHTLADIFFGIFAILFFFCRIILLPIYCIIPSFIAMISTFEGTALIVSLILPIMLTCLYGLQIFWWRIIWLMVLKTLSGKHVEKDSRSDDD